MRCSLVGLQLAIPVDSGTLPAVLPCLHDSSGTVLTCLADTGAA